MAVLKVIRGSSPGQIVELQGERTVLGRHPNCQVVLDNAAVSRHHAQILESHGSYYLEDLRSRNGTYLNGEPVQRRAALGDNDEVKVCDIVFRFYTQLPADAPAAPSTADQPVVSASPGAGTTSIIEEQAQQLLLLSQTDPDGSSKERSSIITTLDAAAQEMRLNVKPETKLRAILEISGTLSNVLKRDELLPRILDSLFKLFQQAGQGFVLLKSPEDGSLKVEATLTRAPEDREVVPLSMTIVQQAMDQGEAVLSADAAGDQRFMTSESVASLQIRSMMCVPLMDQSSRAMGVIQLSTKDISHQFSRDDLDLLTSVASQAALAIENSALHEALLKQRDLERDLEFATQVQLGFLPNERPQIDGYEFADFYEAAYRIGGDYFDYVLLPEGRVALAAGDVAGKGVPAALLMARLYSSARYHLLSTKAPAPALNGLNAEIASSGLGHRFITLALAILDPQAHRLSVANAGHLPPLHRDASGRIVNVGARESGMPIGISPTQTFEEVNLDLQVGDTVVFYTDGVTEAMDANNDIYGRRRLSEYLARTEADVGALVDGIVADVEAFYGDRAQRDDMCVVALRRTK